MLAQLIDKVGDVFDVSHFYDFGLESADHVADFFNNGGLEFHNNGINYALQYAATEDGDVTIGAWVWADGEDFDHDATFEVYEEDDFSAGELKRIHDRIKEIY